MGSEAPWHQPRAHVVAQPSYASAMVATCRMLVDMGLSLVDALRKSVAEEEALPGIPPWVAARVATTYDTIGEARPPGQGR